MGEVLGSTAFLILVVAFAYATWEDTKIRQREWEQRKRERKYKNLP